MASYTAPVGCPRTLRRAWVGSLLCALVLLASSAVAEDDPCLVRADAPAGHSTHGSWFNEGPRQRARRMAEVGTTHLAITTHAPEAQAFFDQGLNQVYGFWWFEAERSFREVLAHDPNCAMGYWGLALANWEYGPRSRALVTEALRRQAGATARERQWIAAVARWQGVDPEAELPPATDFDPQSPWQPTPDAKPAKAAWQRLLRDLEDLIHDDPSDVQAKSFLAWMIWEATRHDVPLAAHEPVDALIAQVLAVEPRHQGAHHFRIHLWDQRKPERALTAAALCGPSAAGIAHCWHMPGHIYDKLHRYADAAWQQQASARVDHAYMAREQVMPYLIHNYAHNQEWLVRSLNHAGRPREAMEFAANLIEIPLHPRFNALSSDAGCAGYGRRRLAETLVDFELWDELGRLAPTPYLANWGEPSRDLDRAWALGWAAWAHHDLAGMQRERDQARACLAELEARRDADEAKAVADDLAAQLKPEEREAAAEKRAGEHRSVRKRFEERLAELEAALAAAQLAKAANPAPDRAAAAAEPLEGAPQVSPAELEKLVKQAGDGARLRMAKLLHAAGQTDRALVEARAAADAREGQIEPLATLVDLLWQAGQADDAAKAFTKLRACAAEADLNTPLLSRLAPLAQALGWPADWRTPAGAGDDLGPRPPLDELGPATWQPWAAPEWQLADADGADHSLSDYRGRPVLLIFYLGLRCLHCVEQLEAFAPRASEFASAGIELVAISTEPREQLAQSREEFRRTDGAEFPFLLLCDAPLDVFRRYRAFDEFEGQPLHATVLIDADGRVRWQDVSYEPFTDVELVLGESRRLLGLKSRLAPAADSATATSAD